MAREERPTRLRAASAPSCPPLVSPDPSSLLQQPHFGGEGEPESNKGHRGKSGAFVAVRSFGGGKALAKMSIGPGGEATLHSFLE